MLLLGSPYSHTVVWLVPISPLRGYIGKLLIGKAFLVVSIGH